MDTIRKNSKGSALLAEKKLTSEQFWDRKILSWEKSRYSPFAFFSGRTIQHRLELAAHIVNQFPAGTSVLDLGCGSGRLFSKLRRDNFSSLTGLDFSQSAIALAQSLAQHEKAQFRQQDITGGNLPIVDLTVALGLIDWISSNQVEELFSRMSGRNFLFSFSEQRAAPLRLLHRYYLKTRISSEAKRYPGFHSAAELQSVAEKAGLGQLYFHRSWRLSFGTLAANFPLSVFLHGK